ncbi:MAG: metallophosphoesterase [Micavibrio aeruginosavorus]|uniref:Metallophosphoesterase n=1 Tax=Micavibrio aeruginosavorus TaxID=349221 RepID=A0A7T5R426_9BACT|nr:MAG: metallophosphoesterase [Micavibrio aeruginosavorus]
MALRIAVITDIHYGFDTGAKKGAQAPKLVEEFIDAAHQFGADYIFNLGDKVSSQNPIVDEQFKKSLRAQFKRAACPVIEIDGNHDVRFQAAQSPSTQLITHGYHIIQWNPYLNRYTREGVIVDDSDIQWLRNELASAQKPVVLLSHIPFGGPESVRKKWKNAHSQELYYPSYFKDSHELRGIIESSGKVMFCLSGHRHLNHHKENNGVHYLIHQSLVEVVEGDKPAGAYSMIEIDGQEVRIHGYGLKQPRLRILNPAAINNNASSPPAALRP